MPLTRSEATEETINNFLLALQQDRAEDRAQRIADDNAQRERMDRLMEIVLANAQQPQRPQLTPNVASDTDPVADTSSRKEIPAPPHEVKHTSPAKERSVGVG